MTLREYLEQSGESDAEFGRRAGVHRTRIWSYRTGTMKPGRLIALRIEKATNGKVAVASWDAPSRKRRSRKAA